MTETKPNNVYWFYKWPLWLKIVLCVFLFPIFIPILVWPKLRMPILSKVIILVIWIILMFAISSFSSANEKNKDIVLNVTGISENEVKKDDKLNLKITSDPITVDEVTVNGEPATKKGFDTEYSIEKTYPEGDNTIKIIAKKGNKTTEKIFNFKVDLSEKKQAEQVKKFEEEKAANEKLKKEEDKKAISNIGVVFDRTKVYLKNNNNVDVSLFRFSVNCDITTSKCAFWKSFAPMLKLPKNKIVEINLDTLVDFETETKRFNIFTDKVNIYDIGIYSKINGQDIQFDGFFEAKYLEE